MVDGADHRVIQLTRGQVALVDDSDFEEISRHRWFAKWNGGTRSFYAVRSDYSTGSCLTVCMHRQILGMIPGDRRHGDHINHDTLDNRRQNLRIATPMQNQMNSRKPMNNTSGATGVHFNIQRRKWQAYIRVNGETKYLGLFVSFEDAAQVRRKSELEYQGEFALQEN